MEMDAHVTTDVLLPDLAPDGSLSMQPAPKDDSSMFLITRGISLRIRFKELRDVIDISEAISLIQQGIQLNDLPEDLPLLLKILGDCFLARFRFSGDIADVSEAILIFQQAIQLTSEVHLIFPQCHGYLGNSFCDRFQQCGDITDVVEAISSLEIAVQLTPKDDPAYLGYLTSLGDSLSIRFQHLGDIKDNSKAISSLQMAVQLIPKDHPNHPHCLKSLGSCFLSRFELFGDIVDVSEAISLLKTAVKLTPKEHPHYPSHLKYLGKSFRARFEHSEDISDISEAVSSLRMAVHFIPKEHPHYSGYITSLGNSLSIRFDRFGDIKDISEAISLLQLAVQHTPKDHPHFPHHLNSLATLFSIRFDHFGNSADISEAISSQKKAVQLASMEHPKFPEKLFNLGFSFQVRFKRFGDIKDIFEAISYYRLAATSKFGSSLVHLNAAKHWAGLIRHHKPSQEIEAYTLIINLMSKVAGMEQTVEMRHTNITPESTLTSHAVAVAFLHGRPDLALDWFEQGRCLVWNQLNQLQKPSHNLKIRYPNLSTKFQSLSTALASAGSRQRLSAAAMDSEDVLAKKVSFENATTIHIKTAYEYNQLVQKIRTIPEFRKFLQPRKASEILAHIPKAGPVILINVQEDRCDGLALVSGHDEPLHIPLERFTYKRAEDLRSHLSKYLSKYRLQTRNVDRAVRPVELVKHVELILRTLWQEVVRPIFDAIGFDKPQSPLSRIWWCTTGPLASLPIHAAGIYREGGICVSDFAVSSYVPTVNMLVDKIKDIHRDGCSRLLLVSQAYPNPHRVKVGDEERTVTLPRIPGVDEETSTLNKLMKDSGIDALRLSGNDATISNVQNEMMEYQSIHLACHGTQDFKKPLQSGFYLLDGRLELSEIMKRYNPIADLAFLSACETSTGDETLTEEAVHLAAGMLTAGYRSVVATMWSIKDNYGPEVAEDFYSELLRGRGGGETVKLDGAGAAYALHYATQRLRKKVGDKDSGLLTWLPYVHFGI